MDLGVPGQQGSVSGHEDGASTRSKFGSGFTKQERSGSGEDGWRSSKLARTEDMSAFKTLSFHQGIPLLRSGSAASSDLRRQEHMLSFSSEKSEAPEFGKEGSLENKSSILPYLQQISSPSTRNAGYGSGGMNTSMHGNLTGVRGPFTLSQWVELELQAMIYKYITANVPVPSSLLLSLKKSFYPYALSSGASEPLPPNSLGWGSFHLGFSGGSADPEPGRCRRTDGKKWRCTRDAVPDQKYCERHINRGRHRSRKPVEGHSGHAPTPAPAATISKGAMMSSAAMMSSSKAVAGGGGCARGPDCLTIGGSVSANPSADSSANRVQNPRGLSMFPSTINLQPREFPLTVSKQGNPFEFGLVSSDCLLNPTHKTPYMSTTTKSYGTYLDFNGQETQSKNTHNHSVIPWPEELKSDWTQLSMSIPIASSDFSSSSSSPIQDKLALSPLRLSREFDPVIHMGLGVNSEICEPVKKLNNWIPISWGNSMGGPLGEVLTSTTNSPKLGSSPTGVLQKSSFGSLSNSSSGSSPVGENKKGFDGVGLCDDLLGSSLLTSYVP